MPKYIEAIYFACNDNSEGHKKMSLNMVKSGRDKLDNIPFIVYTMVMMKLISPN